MVDPRCTPAEPVDRRPPELFSDTQRVTTDNRIIANGLLGLGLELGAHKLRFTNLFIRDTIKQGRLGQTEDFNTGFTRQTQDTAWFERQLFESQFVGEFKLGNVSLDLRGTYANSQREAPYELTFGYVRSTIRRSFGDLFINRLNNGQPARPRSFWTSTKISTPAASIFLADHFRPHHCQYRRLQFQ